MTKDDLLDIRASLDKASYWARKQADLFQVIDAKKKVETLLNETALPSNLDEAAIEWCKTNNKGVALCDDRKSHYLADGVDAFKAGAEWMKAKMMDDAYEEEVQEVYRDDDGIHCCVSVGTDYKPGTIVYVITIQKEEEQ